jgi:hypothetical protein
MVQAVNSYTLLLHERNAGGPPGLVWRTQEASEIVEYHGEPSRTGWRRFEAEFLSHLPLDREL